MLDIAIQQVGAYVVPVYPNISINDYRYIFKDAGISVCFIGNEELFNNLKGIQSELPDLKLMYCLDRVNDIPFWEEMVDTSDEFTKSVEERKANVRNEDLATIIYTSGTSGNP